ncbi:MAG: hypothetical protein ACYTJ0_13765 [Planctomycetota bacterium]|jgi:hypothetical protein
MKASLARSVTSAALALGLGGLAAADETVIVTPADVSLDMGHWHPANERSGGQSLITATRPDDLGKTGSLEQSLPAGGSPSPKSDFELFSADTVFDPGDPLVFYPADGGFGLLSDLDQLAFDFYRDGASTAPDHLTPALRLYLWDPDAGTSYLMVWEGVYNGFPIGMPVPTDQWLTADVAGAFFWRIPQFINGSWAGIGYCNGAPAGECFDFDNTLGDWGFGPDTVVFGVNVGLGSGWAGSYVSFVDNVTIGFAGGACTTYDFETVVDSDGDGVPDEADECPESDLSPTVIIDGCDTEIENLMLDAGCTLADRIAACAADAPNHGQFVKCVVHLAKRLRKDGLLSKDDAARLKKCAAHADLP